MTAPPPLPKFPEVDHGDATGGLAEIYDDIQFSLRVPWVPFAIRVMSLFPAFVPAAWQASKPQVSTRYAEKGADLVRAASIIPGPPPPDPRPKLRAAGLSDHEIGKIGQALDSLNDGNPKGLILITAWNEAWNERAAGGPANSLSPAEARPLPYGLPGGVEKLRLVDPDRADPATWPDLLRVVVEDILAPVALTAEYEDTARRIRDIARGHAAGFPGVAGVSRRQLSDSLSGPEIAGLTGLLFMYNRFLADITIAMIRVKQAFDGAQSATENKFRLEG